MVSKVLISGNYKLRSAAQGTGTGIGIDIDIDIESAAFPPLVRLLAVVIVGGLAAFALWSLPALRGAQWTFPALATFGLAARRAASFASEGTTGAGTGAGAPSASPLSGSGSSLLPFRFWIPPVP